MHFIIVAYADRVDSVLNLVKLVKACGIPFVVVRNKADNIRLNPKQKGENKSLDEVIEAAQREEHDELSKEVGGELQLVYVAADPPDSKRLKWMERLQKLNQ